MNRNTIISNSRSYYRRFYRLVVCAVVIMMAVLAGSLILGDSVRGTLSDRVSERLGSAESVITSGKGFVNEQIMFSPLLHNARGYLLMDGYISADGKLLPVYVWGVDSDTILDGEALVNAPLAEKMHIDMPINGGDAAEVALHLPSHTLVPSGSLFVTKSYATQMRIRVRGVKSVEEGGNLLLKTEQALPLNVFVSRRQLGEVMGIEGKMNVILSDDMLTEEQVGSMWNPALSGVHVTDSSLTYDGIFIQDYIVNDVHPKVRYLSYLVNDIIHETDTVPYSFVTAVDKWRGEPLKGMEIVLSDYAAEHLHVSAGDSVRMSYFLSGDIKNLETNEKKFFVKAVEPLSAFMSDRLLSTEFPGLSNVEKCTDWDSDLPIKMDRIHKDDEEFWNQYKHTPKAIVAYDAVAADWGSSFGVATALRLESDSISLNPHDFLTVVSPREQGVYSANNGTDFSSLFLSLGFFIILSAILLMYNPLLEMFTLRREELQLYQMLGYKTKTIQRILFKEAFSVMLMASPFGVLAGVLYSYVTLWLLGNVWSGATHTEGFAVHLQPLTVLIGWGVGVFVCAVSLWLVIRDVLKPKCVEKVLTENKCRRMWVVGFVLLAVTLMLVVYNFISMHSMALFIVCGLLWTVVFGVLLNAFLSSKVINAAEVAWNRRQMMWQSIYATRKQQLLAYWSLAVGVFTVFAVGLNRPDFSDAEMFDKATGGYDLYVDSRVPVQYDLNNADVRKKLSLSSIPSETRFLQFMRHTQDDASCLNLNKVVTPTILGVRLDEMGAFGLVPQPLDVPCVYVDEEALIWSMMKSVGDTIVYKNGKGEDVNVVIAGTYPTGVFHGNAVMSDTDFRNLWPQEGGIEVMLVKSSDPVAAAEILSVVMSEYGLSIQTTEERIKMFFEVTDTYLIIFLTFGGLGLLLGIFSLIVIVRKNLAASQQTICQLQAMGFRCLLIRRIMWCENAVIPLFAMFTGAIGSVISISANIAGAGISTILFAVVSLLALCLLLTYGIKSIINKNIL